MSPRQMVPADIGLIYVVDTSVRYRVYTDRPSTSWMDEIYCIIDPQIGVALRKIEEQRGDNGS
jgi:hypothetical protein